MSSPKSNILYDDIIWQWNYKIYTFTKSQGIDKCFVALITYLHCDLHCFLFVCLFFFMILQIRQESGPSAIAARGSRPTRIPNINVK